MKNDYYTTGELAKISGVSVRTIRFYDTKGLLKPIDYTETGYRLYDKHSLENLQKILMLKYLGFSLEQIMQIIDEREFMSSLNLQRELLSRKIRHMDYVMKVLDEIISMVKENTELAEGVILSEKSCDVTGVKDKTIYKKTTIDIWKKLSEIISLTNEQENISRQYINDDNLNKRISIHDYGTSTQDFMNWIYDRLNIKEGMKILEIGCGNGLLWKKNMEQIPKHISLTLTDNSDGMLEKVRQIFLENVSNVCIQYMDAENPVIPKNTYDIIIANHMLYHVNNRDGLFMAINEGLKSDGTFICTTVGANHMKELNDELRVFDKNINITFYETVNRFSLENGRQQLEKYFSNIKLELFDDNLLIDNADIIYEYACSYPDKTGEILSKRKGEFMQKMTEKIKRKGFYYITKSTGMFKAGKRV